MLRQILIIPLFIWTLKNHKAIKFSPDTSNTSNDIRQNLSIHNHIQKTMGVSINLYRVGKAEKPEDIKDLETRLLKHLIQRSTCIKLLET
jgi:hypothetical protein